MNGHSERRNASHSTGFAKFKSLPRQADGNVQKCILDRGASRRQNRLPSGGGIECVARGHKLTFEPDAVPFHFGFDPATAAPEAIERDVAQPRTERCFEEQSQFVAIKL